MFLCNDCRKAGFIDPWFIADAPKKFVGTMAKALVGFVMCVEHFSGLWKLHQNHLRENRKGVVEGLRSVGGMGALSIAPAIERLPFRNFF